MSNIGQALVRGRNMLAERGVETAGLDAALLLMKTTRLSRTELVTNTQKVLSEKESFVYSEMLKRRAVFEPVQYITNECEFMSLPFYVDERVLIPRADTETLAEAVINWSKNFFGEIFILDLCCGSGALAVALAYYLPNARITASDISLNALEITRINAERNGVLKRVNPVQSDMFTSFPDNQLFDIIVSNPPYIRSGDIPGLDPGVRDYEPRIALDGGDDGLRFLDRIIQDSGRYLRPDGGLFIEIGYDQGADAVRFMEQAGYISVRVIKDLAEKDRVVSGCN